MTPKGRTTKEQVHRQKDLIAAGRGKSRGATNATFVIGNVRPSRVGSDLGSLTRSETRLAGVPIAA